MVTVNDPLVEKVCYNSQLPWTRDELAQVARDYQAGASVRAVAKTAGVSYTAAYRALKLMGVSLRPSNKDKVRKKRQYRRKSA